MEAASPVRSADHNDATLLWPLTQPIRRGERSHRPADLARAREWARARGALAAISVAARGS